MRTLQDFNFTSNNYKDLSLFERRVFVLHLRQWLTDLQIDECNQKTFNSSIKYRNTIRRILRLLHKIAIIDNKERNHINITQLNK